MGGPEQQLQTIEIEPPDRNKELLRYVDTEILDNPGRFALVILDLDDLKLINDTYGHFEGDQYLANALDVLRTSVRSRAYSAIPYQRSSTNLPVRRPADTVLTTGTALRAHGDEYWIVLRNISDQSDVDAFMSRLKTDLDDLGIAASMGGAAHKLGQTATELYCVADARSQVDKLLRVPERTPEEQAILLRMRDELERMNSHARALEKELAAMALRQMLRTGCIPELFRVAEFA